MAEPLILTTIGLAKLASATPEDQLEIASVAVGDGNGGYPPLDPSMTALVHEVWRGTASAPIRDPDNDAVLIFETIIPPEDGGFFIREVGLFDADGDLIAIGQTGLVEKPSGGSGTPMTMTVRVRLALANAAQTNLIINDAPYIDHQALTNRNASNAHPISSITGLQGALDGKLAIVQNLADLDDVATARSNLGLGTAAVANIATTTQAQALTDDTTVITPKKLGDAMNAHVLGMGQSWQDVTSSRASGVTYTNTTGRPIFVSIVHGAIGQGAKGELLVDGVLVASVEIPQVAASGEKATLSAVVPAGSTYQHTNVDGGIASWAELR